MKLNLVLAILILLLTSCDGVQYDAVNPAVTTCANGSTPITEESKGMVLCPVIK